MPLMKWQREVRPTLCKTHGEIELFQSISNIVEDEYIEKIIALENWRKEWNATQKKLNPKLENT